MKIVIWNVRGFNKTHTQYIHDIVQNSSSSKQFAFTAIYGLHTIAHMCDMWEALRRIDSQMANFWLIMGDFNAVMDIEDRDCKLNELNNVDRSYTWTNNHVYSRIDRAIVNAHWMMSMPPMQVNVMDPQFSDHSPLCIELDQKWILKGNLSSFSTAWKEFVSTTSKVQQLRETLANIQAQMRTTTTPEDMFEIERNTKQQLKKWSKIEESIYIQRSRIQWLQLGDSNIAFSLQA
ncbi:uncharacterized protein LOC142165216 [Nicotiana tabacum]|uniref:Uncharacterized protein LOC142165216 n=1 Tax=Nicotiana tabacum TaxID=4097 RepID=A0AC58S4L7_TOBAC